MTLTLERPRAPGRHPADAASEHVRTMVAVCAAAGLLAPAMSRRPGAVVGGTSRRDLLTAGVAFGVVFLAGCSAAAEQEEAPVARRTVSDVFGQVEVPAEPRRVIALYDDALDIALALGLPLVGGPGERGSATNPFRRTCRPRRCRASRGSRRSTTGSRPRRSHACGRT